MSQQFVQNYTVNPNCGPGLWRQVFYLNTSSQDQSCPGDWNFHTVSSVRGCVGADASCQSTYSDEIGYEYSTVCGRVIGIGTVTPDAFFRFISGQTTIEGNYLDGVSVTHGAPGSRIHIWSFGAGHPPPVARCPCENPNRTEAPLPPFKVEQIISAVQKIIFGLEVTATLPALAVPFTIFHTSVYNFLHQLLTR